MQSAFSLAGRVGLVTGGARGIGRAVAEALSAAGAQCVIADAGVDISGANPDVSLAAAAADAIGGVAFTEDISAPGAAQRAVDLAVERFGAIDIVVNGAAILRDAFIFKSRREDWDRVLQTNLTGAYATLAAATPLMREAAKQGRAPGRIVNLVSTAGLYGNFGQAAYASTKGGLVALTRVVAMDLARSGIHCNAVAPFAATRVTDAIRPANDAQAVYKARAMTIPAGYVARLVAWLAASACAVTGQLFGIRGREVFLFSQPRPIARVVTPALAELTPESLDSLITMEFTEHFTDLATDLEAFNTEPLL
ncbi:MAG TPA: SDR family NAD(P)-dependent oxidoreductase [Burkholderiales bacterium]|nr:SDR family NAD(P)-dependent oxidoreductase [Burkholderiales bacterium]